MREVRPEIREIYELSTRGIRPEPGALDRQYRRQVRSSAGRRIGVFATVAALVAALAIGVVVVRPTSRQEGVADRPGIDPLPSWATKGPGVYAYSLGTDGAEATYLTELPGRGVGRRISVSADGSMLAFSLLRRGMSQIWVVNIDGGGLRRLTDDAYEATDPAFSPDGSEIAYIGFGTNGRRQLFVLDMANGGARQLTHGSVEPFWPSWSPDAETIVVSQAKPADVSVWSGTDHVGLFSVDVLTGARSRLRMQARASNAYADYSPTGSALAFLHWLPRGAATIAMSNVDGSRIDVIGKSLQTGGQQFPPEIAPSGARVAYDQSDDDGRSSTYVLDMSGGSDPVRIPASIVGWLDGQTLLVQVGR